MATRVIFHRLAAKEAREAEAWYARDSSAVALTFRSAVDAAVIRIVAGTGVHQIEGSRLYYVRLRKFPYRLIYVERAVSHYEIIAVMHDHRRPNYWRRRQ